MAFVLREYQQQAVDATIKHFKKSNEAAVIVLPTGAGKSLVIAELAKRAKGRVLVLAHVKELVEQNQQKLSSYGISSGIFSAGLKEKNLKHPITFASIQSVARNLSLFAEHYSLLIIDECHRVSIQDDDDETNIKKSQYQQLIEQLQQKNTALKILGLTATPFRLGSGWIYQYHYQGYIRSTETRLFIQCIYELSLRYLIKKHYLTEPKLIDACVAEYDFSQCQSKPGLYPEISINRLLVTQKRITKSITEQIIAYSDDRCGVMIFAASVDHAKEIAGYFAEKQMKNVAILLGDTEHKTRDEMIQRFKQRQIKYLINVSVLTTGFDAPHVDMIAILRPTQSVSLYQQIIGRGLRLHPGKNECLIIDYAGNGYDLYQPEIDNVAPHKNTQIVHIHCPLCQYENNFWGIEDEDGYVIEHYGRRCQSFSTVDGLRQQCLHRFKFKQCPQCNAENDIAARRCNQCDDVLIDPDDKLKDALNLKNAMVIRCAAMQFSKLDEKLKIHYVDEDGHELTETFDLRHKGQCYVFNQQFGQRFAQGLLNTEQTPYFTDTEELLDKAHLFNAPDFVIARKKKYYWKIQEKIFDYEGNFRKANALK